MFEGRWLPADDAEVDQFSKDGIGEHLRVHPLLAWREIDVWRYIERLASDVAGLVALPGLAARAGAY